MESRLLRVVGQFPYVAVRGRGRPLEAAAAAAVAAAASVVVVVVADVVVGHGSVGQLLAVVELVRLAATRAVQREGTGAVSPPEAAEVGHSEDLAKRI